MRVPSQVAIQNSSQKPENHLNLPTLPSRATLIGAGLSTTSRTLDGFRSCTELLLTAAG